MVRLEDVLLPILAIAASVCILHNAEPDLSLEEPELEIFQNSLRYAEPTSFAVPNPALPSSVIVIGMATTTRNTEITVPEDLPFFEYILESFLETFDPDFEYWFYLGYDHGDTFYDNADNQLKARQLFMQRTKQAMAKLNVARTLHRTKFRFRMIPYRYAVKIGAPAWVSSDVMRQAYDDGADFFMRVNDDSIFVTPGWARRLVQALGSHELDVIETGVGGGVRKINFFGMVGPACNQGKPEILTHDLVSRLHLDIHRHYYPRTFPNWWSDD